MCQDKHTKLMVWLLLVFSKRLVEMKLAQIMNNLIYLNMSS